MIKNPPKIYLASRSPRRKKLLRQINLEFEVFSVDVKEEFHPGETPEVTVLRLAREKMEAAKKIKDNGILITADTIVVLNNKRIGKPENRDEAKSILKSLSDNSHFVYTGFSIYNPFKNKTLNDFVKTEVSFRYLDDNEIEEYIETGSPMDKAGAYGIQDDYGAVFVEEIKGCYYNVVGLPVARLYSKLKEIIEFD